MKSLRMKALSQLCLITTVVITSLAGCVKEQDYNPTEENGSSITLAIAVPGMNMGTRALSGEDENQVSTIDVLVFKEVDGDEKFYYHTHGTNIDNSAAERKFSVSLRNSSDGNERHRFVIIANLRAAVTDAVAGFSATTTKESALAAISFSTNARWNTTSSSVFTPLPMWGQSAGLHVVTNTLQSSQIGTIKMLRALAKVDVGLNFSASDVPQGLGNTFTIADVNVHNAQSEALIAPATAHLTGEVVSAPSIPGTSSRLTTPITYSHTPADYGFVREIYIAEADNHVAGLANNQMTCLLVSGYYNGSTVKSWYRIDFYERTQDPSTAQSRLDILRNHRYKVNITSVGGPGYATEAEALNSSPINMSTEIIVWNEGEMNDIVFDGQYFLKVNMDEVNLFSEGRAQTIKVETDHPAGWSIEASDSWVTYTPTTGITTTPTEVAISASTFTSTPPALDYRDGYLTIKAGKLSKKIKVHQSNEPELTIEVTPNELIFRKSGSNVKTVTVTTYPADLARSFSRVGTIPWTLPGTATGIPADGLTETTYAIRPPVNGTNNVLNSTITVFVTRNGKMVSQDITVRQLATDLLFSYETTNPYPAIGGTNLTFKVTSEAAWNILTTSPAGVVTIPNTQHAAATDEVVGFKLEPNPTFAQRTVALNVTSAHPDFPTQNVSITQNFTPPFVALSNNNYAFGASTSSVNIDVNSNCNWKYADIPSGGSSSTASGSFAMNTTIPNTGATPTAGKVKTITFTRYAWPKAAGTPASGTVTTATFKFSTVNHAPASEQSAQITLSATVPGLYATPEFSHSNGFVVPRAGTAISASLWSNIPWYLENTLGQRADVATGSYAKRLTTITVLANNSWANRNVTFAIKSSFGQHGGNLNVSQAGYTVGTLHHSLPGTIPAAGGTYQFAISGGDYPALPWRVLVNGGQTSGGTLPANGGSASFVVPENTTTAQRNVEIQLQINGTWTRIGGSPTLQSPAPYVKSHDGTLGWSTQTLANGAVGLLPGGTTARQAYDFCRNSSWGGYTGWRTPTHTEFGQTEAPKFSISMDSDHAPYVYMKEPRYTKMPSTVNLISQTWGVLTFAPSTKVSGGLYVVDPIYKNNADLTNPIRGARTLHTDGNFVVNKLQYLRCVRDL